MMRKGLLAVLMAMTVVAALAVPALADDGDQVLGSWLTEPSENGRARVEITRDGDAFNGRIVWLEQPLYPADDEGGMAGQPKVDRENPDSALRTRPILGLAIVSGFHYDGDDLWKGGIIYDPESGKTYKCKMWLTDEGTLKVRGYVGFSLLGRTTVWVRPPQTPASDGEG